jgi:hypothetical protein
VDPEEELVCVYRSNRMDAEMMRSVLEGSGIPAVNMGGGMSGAYPVNVGTLGEGRVMVKRSDEAAARDILAAATHGDLELDEEPELPPARYGVYTIAVIIVAVLLYLAWKSTGL